MKKIKDTIGNNIAFCVWIIFALICLLFILSGNKAEDGSITLDGKPAIIEGYTEKFIENANQALYRLMNEDKPTDEETIKASEGLVGLGGSVTLDGVISRMLPDGDNDNGLGWQCSKYTGWLATGIREYSSIHPDYGPANGKDMADYLVRNFGWQYTDKPVKGAIGSGGFNTLYGHTVAYLYSTGENTAMVNDANYVPLKVSTHNMNVSDFVWVIPGDYIPDPEPVPEPEPEPVIPDAPNTGVIK